MAAQPNLPTVEFELEVRIERPVREVFAYVTDVRNLPEWQESALEAEWEGDDPVATGSRIREKRTFLGRTAESELEVTGYDPDRSFDVEALSGPIRFRIRHGFEEIDGGTLLRVRAEAEAGGMLRLAGPMVARQVERQFRSDLERLKKVLESN
jgi:uncharacterized membrane protein